MLRFGQVAFLLGLEEIQNDVSDVLAFYRARHRLGEDELFLSFSHFCEAEIDDERHDAILELLVAMAIQYAPNLL